jgi:tRNA G46 methylase TrmB
MDKRYYRLMIINDENEKKIALNWIKMIESERGKIRATDIYPKLRSFLDNDSTKKILEIGSGQGSLLKTT